MATKPKTIPDGLIVIFEGLDGVGKSTQLRLAADSLLADGWAVHTTRNLGGTPIGEALRDAMLAKLERPPATDFYVSIAIQEALFDKLDAERAAGKIILIDRSPLSLAAYQIYGSGFDEATGWRAVDNGMQSMRPELIMQYKTAPKTARHRALETGPADYFESKPLDYFGRVAHGYDLAAERYPVHVLDAAQPIAELHEATMQLLTAAMSSKQRAA